MIHRVYNACWYLVGGLILLAAVAITIIRLLLPGIDAYREQVEAIANRYSTHPITIEAVSASWKGWNPQLNFEGVTLLDPDKHQPIAGFDSASVRIALLASLWQQQLIPESLIINGADLQLIRGSDGSISFGDKNLHPLQDPKQDQFNQKLTRWLLARPMISLRDSNLLWIDEQSGQPPLLLQEAALNLRTWQNRIQINGHARLPETHGETINFALDANGNLLSGKWSGQGYIDIQNIQPAAWPEYNHWQDLNIRAGSADLRLWSDWRDARLIGASGLIACEDTLLRAGTDSNLIRELTAAFRYQRNDNSDAWQLQANVNRLVTWNGSWPETYIQLSGTDTRRIDKAYISHLQLDDIVPLTDLVALLPEKARSWLHSSPLRGVIEDLHYQRITAPDDWLLSGQMISSRLLDNQGKTSASGLSGDFLTSAQRGSVSFNTTSLQIHDDRLFRQPVNNLAVDGTVSWQHAAADDGWLIRGENLTIDTIEQRLSLRGTLLFNDDGLPKADIVASLSGGEIEPLKQFIPVAAKDKLKRWLRNSLIDGRMAYGGLVLRGDLDDFPFRNKQGQFKINARFDQVTMDYDEKWPPIYQIDGDLAIERDVLNITVPVGEIYKARVSDVRATIADLYAKDHILHIEGNAQGPADAAIQFLKDSPLRQKSTIKRLLELKISGDMQMALDMNITLYPGEDHVSGDIELLGNRITAQQPELDLHAVKGRVSFSGDNIESRNLTGRYHDRAVDLAITRSGDIEGAPTVFRMSGQADAPFISGVLKDKLPADDFNVEELGQRLQGQTQWHAEIRSYPDSGKPEMLRITSDLEGLAVELPAPLGKSAGNSRPLQLQFSLPPSGQALQEIQLDYANILAARFNNNGLLLSFGEPAEQAAKSQQIRISGRTGRLELGQWLQLLEDYRRQVTANGNIWAVDMDLTADEVVLDNQNFFNTRLQINRSDKQWDISVNGADIDGRVSIPASGRQKPIIANFTTLHLDPITKDSATTSRSNLDPRSLPPLSVDIANLIYDKSELGAFSMQADSIAEGLRINRFSFNKPGMDIQGHGSWKSISNEIFSQFEIKLHADKAATMLQTFGYVGETIDGGVTDINVTALWPGSPMNFSLARMNGSLELWIKDGRFLEIDPKAGRVFGLLSIQTLPRRLSLDFTDLFNKGFAFDRIHGEFAIEDGDAYTNNLTMEGPAALITVTGRTGLVAQDYDQTVTVIPQVSDSLPVASALFGPIGIGVGAVIFLTGQVFESIPDQIDRLLGYQYSITGSWRDPIIKPVSQKTPTPLQSPVLGNSQ